MPADRVPLEDYAVAHDGFAEKPLLANSKAHSNVARLVIQWSQMPEDYHCTHTVYASKLSCC
jgi:hypothetical protein